MRDHLQLLPIMGEKEVTFLIGDLSFTHTFLFYDSHSLEILLGFDLSDIFIRSYTKKIISLFLNRSFYLKQEKPCGVS